MTSRLYYTDAYRTAFDARITELSRDGRRVYLDQSAFYPTSGGQLFDVGSLGGAAVADVIDEDERVAHVLAAPLGEVGIGDSVRGEIDWQRRFDHMQQHTGQHLLSAVFADLFGFETASVHFGAERSSLDLDVGAIDAAQLGRAERRANEIVWENRPVSVGFEDSATATGLRKPPPREGMLRIVTIEGLDRSACGGTHVRATGEIGALTLRGTERVRKQTRVEFLCGLRVVRQARADFETLSAIALSMKASIGEAPALIASQGEQLRDVTAARKRLEGELAVFQARELYDGIAPTPGGARVAVVRRDAGSLEELRPLAQAFAALPRAAFVAAIASPATVLIAASDDAGVDAGAVLKPALAAAGGRGGGSPRLAQGTVPSVDALDGVIASVKAGVA
ncbi:MAG TPA: alanyl-tRNA editing protein [Gemmatimonadaceae bacterium]|nr:alanyl-tRNA editing protein [Gemmatimonadaceae bacterium]